MEQFWHEHWYILFILLIGSFGYIVWSLKTGFSSIRGDIKEIQLKQSKLREETLPNEYVRLKQYNLDIAEIKELLQKIFDELKCKVDRDSLWDGKDRRNK